MIYAGALRQMVTIQRNEPALDQYGEESENWQYYATRRASVKPIRGREYFTSKEVASEVTHRIVMRHDRKVGAITPKDRIVMGSREFDIDSIMNIEERDRMLEIMAVERI